MSSFALSRDQLLEAENLVDGVLAPLAGFMSEAELRSVVDTMSLPSGEVFPLPIVLDLSEADANAMARHATVELTFEGTAVGELAPTEPYRCDKAHLIRSVFGTEDPAHPGVAQVLAMRDTFVGGRVTLHAHPRERADALTPAEVRSRAAAHGWKTMAGFQTRNVPHRAHEYLQRAALEHVDGLLIHPLVGHKKAGDYTPEAVTSGYRALCAEYYPPDRVIFAVLLTAMRYAGPREAVFHALIRRNFGCSHFIVGRDHAGVGSYYGKYEAQTLACAMAERLGIAIMALAGPYYCRRCASVVTEKTCRHRVSDPGAVVEISGTEMRALLQAGAPLPEYLMRADIVAALQGIDLVIR